jgi:hypothetical protein
MTESFGNWISLKSDEELDNKSWELKRRDSIKTRIKRLVLCTIPDSSEFETNKDYLTLRMYDIDKSLYKIARVWEILEHGWGGFGNWIENFMAGLVGGIQNVRFSHVHVLIEKEEWPGKATGPLKKSLTDISRFIPEKRKIIMGELKKRSDTGGTSARRELMTKTEKIVEKTLENTVIWKLEDDSEVRILDYLASQNIKKIELYHCILFNPDGSVGDVNRDSYIKKVLEESEERVIDWIADSFMKRKEEKNIGKLKVKLDFFKKVEKEFEIPIKESGEHELEIETRVVYGNEIFRWFFDDKDMTMEQLPIIKTDDFQFAVESCLRERRKVKMSKSKKNDFLRIIHYIKDKKISKDDIKSIIKFAKEEKEDILKKEHNKEDIPYLEDPIKIKKYIKLLEISKLI